MLFASCKQSLSTLSSLGSEWEAWVRPKPHVPPSSFPSLRESMHCPSSSWCHPWVPLLPCHISTHLQVIKLFSEVYLLNILSVASPLPLPPFHNHLLPRVPWQLPNLPLPVFRLTSFIQSPFYSINILKHKCYPIAPIVETSFTGVSFPHLVNHALHSLVSSPELSLLFIMLPTF